MSANNCQAAQASTEKLEPIFHPFEWVTRKHQVGPYEMIANTRDLVGGACVILEMIEQSDRDTENEDAPIFNDYYKGRLFRMAVAALQTIEMQTAAHLEKMQRDGQKRAEKAVATGDGK
jgi:hypothetical protein